MMVFSYLVNPLFQILDFSFFKILCVHYAHRAAH